MKTLIVYYSHTGNNKLLTETIHSSLDADVLRVTATRKRNQFNILIDMIFGRSPRINPLEIDWEKYDHLILIAPIYNYVVAHPMRTFIKKEKMNFDKYSFATLCIGRDGQKEKIVKELTKRIGRPPENVLELWINDLVLPEQRDEVKHVSNYTVTEEEMKTFEDKIQRFILNISPTIKI